MIVMSWISTVPAILVLLLIAYIIYMSSTHGTFKKLGVPGPRPWPLLGNFDKVFRKGFFEYQMELYSKYKDHKVVGFYDSRTPIMMIRDLDMIRDICVKHFNNFINRRRVPMDEPLDHALTFIKDDHWKNVRKVVSPTFSSGSLRRMYTHIEKNTKRLLENLKAKQERNEEMELKHILSCYTMDCIASSGFGVEIDTLNDKKNEFEFHAKAIIGGIYRFMALSTFLPILFPVLRLLKIGIFPRVSIDFFGKFTDSVMNSRKQGSNAPVRNDFLQLMMEAKDKDNEEKNNDLSHGEAMAFDTTGDKRTFSYNDIQGQALIFMMAGYDTMSTVMSFTMYLLALNPDCCKKAQQEIDEKLDGAFPTYDNIQNLPYLELCINESMRLFPPGFAILRISSFDVTIQGVHIPKDMEVLFPMYAIHRDPDIWPEPEKFIPERFTAENKSSRHPYAHLPFGQGPRNCIAIRLAQLELRIAISAILQRMTPVPCAKSEYPVKLQKFLVMAQNGLWVKMKARRYL